MSPIPNSRVRLRATQLLRSRGVARKATKICQEKKMVKPNTPLLENKEHPNQFLKSLYDFIDFQPSLCGVPPPLLTKEFSQGLFSKAQVQHFSLQSTGA